MQTGPIGQAPAKTYDHPEAEVTMLLLALCLIILLSVAIIVLTKLFSIHG